MKKRQGFVSNSSSSSFIVKRNAITDDQYNKLINCMSESDKYGGADDPWFIKDHGEFIIGSTYMDNFDMDEFCFDNNIPVKFFSDEYDAEYYMDNLTGDDDEN